MFFRHYFLLKIIDCDYFRSRCTHGQISENEQPYNYYLEYWSIIHGFFLFRLFLWGGSFFNGLDDFEFRRLLFLYGSFFGFLLRAPIRTNVA